MVTLLVHLFLGYVLCILFPCPWLSAKVLSLWQSYGVKAVEEVENLVDNPTPTTDPTPVVTDPVTPPAPETPPSA